MTLYETSLAVGISVAILTVCGLIFKVLWEFINLRVAAKYKDYMTRPQLKILMKEVLDEQKVITSKDLLDFCNKAQSICPRRTEIGTFSAVLNTFTSTMAEVVKEQKILRQNTLPKEYISLYTFEKTIERLEKSFTDAVKRVEQAISKFDQRMNGYKGSE